MKNKVRIKSDSGSYEIETEGSPEEILAVFGDFYGTSILSPTSRFVPQSSLPPALPPQQPYVAPPIPVVSTPATVIQEAFDEEDPIAERLRELEDEVNNVCLQPTYQAQPFHHHPVPPPAAAQPTFLGEGNPAIDMLRQWNGRMLSILKMPSFWVIDVPLIVVVLVVLPQTQPIVKAVPLIGQPVVNVVQGAVQMVRQLSPKEEEKPKPEPKPSTK